jgi:hypothetical protein
MTHLKQRGADEANGAERRRWRNASNAEQLKQMVQNSADEAEQSRWRKWWWPSAVGSSRPSM